ncbi:TonB-dependent receptor plug domain-containing protein [Candidatus Electronema sp. TJ]|uniref:TonB-dependent receptor plug domain-containing protein n=1 Tax=Candidatus Electronema sp. TJ TaxID=3401573 RepID=UPI003AA80673
MPSSLFCPRLLRLSAGAAFLLPASSLAADQPQEVTMQEVVVTGTRSPHPVSEAPVETLVITHEDIERTPASNLPQLLKTLPGLSAAMLDDNLTADNLRLTMRGMQIHDGYGLILVDGRRVHSGLGGHGEYGVSLNQIPLSMIERIEVVRGASSALYGADAMAGVINIITKPVPSKAEGSAGVSYGTYEVMPKAGDSVRSSTRRQGQFNVGGGMPVGKNSGFYLHAARQSDDGSAVDPQAAQRDTAQGKWTSRLSEALSGELGFQLGKSRQDLAPTPGVTASYNRQHDEHRLSGGLDWRKGAHALKVSSYVYNNDFETGYAGSTNGYRFGDIGYVQGESVYTFFGDSHWLTAGLEAQRQDIDYSFNNKLDALVIPVRQDVDTYSLFVQDEIYLLDQRLTLVPGFRYEDHSRFGGEFNPKLTVSYRTDIGTTWRASVGRAFKSPTLRQLYYNDLYLHSTTNYIRSNPDLSPETALSWNLSAEQPLRDGRWWGSLGLYRNDISEMVVQTDTGEVYDGLPVTSYANVQEARVEGVELSFRIKTDWDGVSLKGGAALTSSENRDTGKELPYTPEYSFSLTPSYQFADGKTGIDLPFIANGPQYRDQKNTQEVDAHQVLDLRLWRLLGENLTGAVELSNIFESHKGDETYSPRQGFGLLVSLTARF